MREVAVSQLDWQWPSQQHNFRHFLSPHQYEDGCIWLAMYDFLLVSIVTLGLGESVVEYML